MASVSLNWISVISRLQLCMRLAAADWCGAWLAQAGDYAVHASRRGGHGQPLAR